MDKASRIAVRLDADDLDPGKLAVLTRRLRDALLELDVVDVEFETGAMRDSAKGAGAVLGWLWVTLGGVVINVVVNRVADFVASVGRSAKITVGDKTLELGRVSQAEQRELINAFLAQFPPPARLAPPPTQSPQS